ncbi:MAG: DoxX family protein [Flavobacteriales bacterium]|nr:DoxX family protein [Flavobacteriales bacterium]
MKLNQQIAILIARLLLGFIFLMQGFGKVFTYGVEQVYEGFFKETYQDHLPEILTYTTAYYTSYVELLGGAFLILGLYRDYALYALGSVLVIITFGHGLAEPIWDLSHMMFRAMLLIGLLLLPKEWDKFSVDSLLRKD